MQRYLCAAVLCACLVVAFVGSAAADDLTPPPWQRFEWGTTFAKWEFSSSDEYASPDAFYNPVSAPLAHFVDGPGLQYMTTWGGRTGVWASSGTIEVPVQNYAVPYPKKDVWVQITWAKQASDAAVSVFDLATGLQGTLVQQTALGPTGYSGPGDTWYHSTFVYHLYPMPAQETVMIGGNIMVDELVIDTVPEPSSLVFLAGSVLGLAGLAWRKRQ